MPFPFRPSSIGSSYNRMIHSSVHAYFNIGKWRFVLFLFFSTTTAKGGVEHFIRQKKNTTNIGSEFLSTQLGYHL